MSYWDDRLILFDGLIEKCPRFERKGKSMIYTSANGHMFSILNKDGEIGIRFSKERQKEYMEKYETTLFKSYNSVMHGYILITDKMLKNEKNVIKLLNESFEYVMSLETKWKQY